MFGSRLTPTYTPVEQPVGRPRPRVVERLGGDLQHERLLRQHLRQFLRRDAEARQRDASSDSIGDPDRDASPTMAIGLVGSGVAT